MAKRFHRVVLGVLGLLWVCTLSASVLPGLECGPLVLRAGEAAGPGDLSLVSGASGIPVVVEPGNSEAVLLAARDFAADVARVSGLRPGAVEDARDFGRPGGGEVCVWVGRLGGGGLVDRLVAEGRLDVRGVAGAWEAGLVSVVDQPCEGVSRALVVAANEARGLAYSLYDLSEAIGVSPWYWWADVTPLANPSPTVRSGRHVRGAPAVRYRGIFINDEDWGLQPWAAKVHEPELGDIGPATYDRIAELLLRLRANTLWPAMHKCTAAFFSNPDSVRAVARRGIVVGTSHAEPMLRNNVREWTADPKLYDYGSNPGGVLDYWEARVREAAGLEALWTLGMRGIHDSAMQGAASVEEQRLRLEEIFARQRGLLDRHVKGGAAAAPQVFCAYKEVLAVYRSGLRVPPDVTLVWPDDNFGFVRNFPQAAEAAREGGNGVYYHISYLGRPLSYLWLDTTPPALVWAEMTRAWRAGSRRLWVVNVGDLKPMERGTEFFLRLAWDADRAGPGSAREFLRAWAAREFGPAAGDGAAALMEAYYAFNYTRRPEHLQGWMPGEAPRPGPFDAAEGGRRASEALGLLSELPRVAALVPPARADAFAQLVEHPVRSAAFANLRHEHAQARLRALELGDAALASAEAEKALAWHASLLAETRRLDTEVAGGRWRGMVTPEPADREWRSMRLAPFSVAPPASAPASAPGAGGAQPVAAADSVADGPEPASLPRPAGVLRLELPLLRAPEGAAGPRWETVPGLGRRGDALALMPPPAAPAGPLGAPVSFSCEVPASAGASHTVLRLSLLPTHPLVSGATRRLVVGAAGRPLATIEIPPADGGPDWSRAVLSGVRCFRVALPGDFKAAGRLEFSSCDTGLIVDSVELLRMD